MANATGDLFRQDNTTILDDIAQKTTRWVTENPTSPNSTDPRVSGPALFKLRDESWVLPLLILSSLVVVAIVIFELYVLYKSCGSRRHLLLGQTLLFGLFLCALLGYAFVLTPRWFLCAVTRAGVGLAYVIVFATLLVKCLFLLGLHSGTYLNAAYQSLLLFFAIGVQVAISSQWLVYQPAGMVMAEEDRVVQETCRATPAERAQYLSYAMFLILMVVVGAIRARTLRENNKEALYIGITIGLLVVIWVAWISVLIIFGRRYEDPAQGFGLVCTAIVAFLLVFMPKAVQLSLANKNGSTTGSQSMVFTPSFLHLQPHAVLPSGAEGTIIKQSTGADYCRGFSSRMWNSDYPTFYQMEPRVLNSSELSSPDKCNVSFVRMPK